MIDLLIFIGFLIAEFVIGLLVNGTYVLLIFPFLQFLNGRSLSSVLMGAFFAGFFVEAIHGLLPGAILLGLAFAVLFTHLTVGTINWSLPFVQFLGTALYLLIVYLARFIIVSIVYYQLQIPDVLPWLITFVLAFPVLLVRWKSMSLVSRGDRYAQ